MHKDTIPGPDSLSDSDIPTDHTALHQFIVQQPRAPSHLILQIPPSHYVLCEVGLPLVAEQHLRQAISFQIPQLTPFTASEVVFFSGVRQRDTAQKRLMAWLLAIPHKTLRSCLNQFPHISPASACEPNQPPTMGDALWLTYRLGRRQSVWSWQNPATVWALISLVLISLVGLQVLVHTLTRQQPLLFFDQVHIQTRPRSAIIICTPGVVRSAGAAPDQSAVFPPA